LTYKRKPRRGDGGGEGFSPGEKRVSLFKKRGQYTWKKIAPRRKRPRRGKKKKTVFEKKRVLETEKKPKG